MYRHAYMAEPTKPLCPAFNYTSGVLHLCWRLDTMKWWHQLLHYTVHVKEASCAVTAAVQSCLLGCLLSG